MNESAVRARAKKANPDDARFALVPITPEVAAKLQVDALTSRAKRQPDPLAGTPTSLYRVASPDVLSVTVWEHPELTIPAGAFRADTATGSPVMADGNIFYPHAGLVAVDGKTLPEIRELLTQRLSKVLEKPQLDVRVAAFRAYKVFVTGEVKVSSTLPLTDVPLRVLDAINLCQGVTDQADLRHVVLTRKGTSHSIDLQATSEEGDLSQNWILVDGDVLHVPDLTLQKVFVLGEVKTPATRFLRKGRLSLADALSESGWLNHDSSSAAGIYVIRGDYDKPKVYRLDARSPEALLLATAFPLRPLDVVFVSTHKLTQWNRIVTQLLPSVLAVSQPALYLNGVVPPITVTP